jgi:hypothetical protein
LGLRLFFLTLGPRARVGFFPDWQLFSIGGELGFRFQVGRVEPHIELGAGYSALGTVTEAIASQPDAITISGADARISGGLDIFVTNVLSLGFAASWELLVMTRPGVDPAELSTAQQQGDVSANQEAILAAEGSGVGSSVTVGAKLGLHF